ncbi:MFS transporter [Tenggerimyces flavus]|uniref:MFS transporter n=1 Tax=Tenggerimyces flavus TaxID=1708749 RepID=A0ABV7YQW3_9ACTN|nr:MFS transporter [Tenggerimyces flavus]MBM7785770.1 MFS family permease [Tenggerimyces flavus]
MSTTEQTLGPPNDQKIRGRAWAVLIVLCGTIFLEGIDVSMMGVALPSIRAELGMSTVGLQWVVSAYVLGYGGFVLLGGRAADLLGRRRMFLTFIAIFIVFSGLGGLATEGWMLIVARFATGVAAAFLTPASISIVTTTFAEGRQRNQAMLVFAGAGAGGFSLGMVVGGLLSAVDWRWVFFAPVIMSTAILIGAIALLPKIGRIQRQGGFDLAGALTLTGAMLLLVYGLVQLPEVDAGQTIATIAASLLLLAAFVAIERKSPDPLIRFGILRSASLVRANVGAMLLVGSFTGFQFITVLYLQELRGWSEIETGLALAVAGIDAILAPTVTPILVRRYGNAKVIVGGFLAVAAAYALLLPLGMDWSFLMLLPSMLLLGVAFTLTYGPLMMTATDGVAESEQGLASGIVTTSFQFGSALGLAIVAMVLAAAVGASVDPVETLNGYRTALLVPVAGSLIAIAVALTGARRKGA